MIYSDQDKSWPIASYIKWWPILLSDIQWPGQVLTYLLCDIQSLDRFAMWFPRKIDQEHIIDWDGVGGGVHEGVKGEGTVPSPHPRRIDFELFLFHKFFNFTRHPQTMLMILGPFFCFVAFPILLPIFFIEISFVVLPPPPNAIYDICSSRMALYCAAASSTRGGLERPSRPCGGGGWNIYNTTL